jgi:hypothetical protein
MFISAQPIDIQFAVRVALVEGLAKLGEISSPGAQGGAAPLSGDLFFFWPTSGDWRRNDLFPP